MTDMQAKAILDDLEGLIREAERGGFLLHSKSMVGEFWFTPQELREENQNGRFIWSRVNWNLCRPIEHIEDMERTRLAQARTLEQTDRKIAELRQKYGIHG